MHVAHKTCERVLKITGGAGMAKKLTKGLLCLLLFLSGFFIVTFTVYFFNLDMKLTAAIEPLLLRHYDRIKRDQHL